MAASLPYVPAATWRSGYAAACKAVYTGSIPVVASGYREMPGFAGDSPWETSGTFSLILLGQRLSELRGELGVVVVDVDVTGGLN